MGKTTQKLFNLVKTVKEGGAAFVWKATPLKNPKTLSDLRDHMTMKLRQSYEEGYFVFSLNAVDDQPILLISSESHKEDGIKAEYYKMALNKEPGKDITIKAIHGHFSAKAQILKFTTLPPREGASSKNKEMITTALAAYKKAQLDEVAEALWASFGPIDATLPKAIFLDGINLVPSKAKKGHWVVAEYNLAKALLAAKLPGQLQDIDGESCLVTPSGIRLDADSTVRLEVFGAIAETAKAHELMAQVLQDGLTEVFEKHIAVLAKALQKSEAAVQAGKLSKEAAVDLCAQALETLHTDFEQEGMTLVNQKWEAHVHANYAARRYTIKAGISIIANGIGVISGIGTAVTTGVTGIGGALGLALTVRKSLNLAADLYTLFREVETVRKLLDKQLTKQAIQYLQRDNSQDWKEVGRTFLETLKLAKPINALSDLVGGEKNVKTVEQLGKDVVEFKAKTNGVLKSVDAYLKTATTLMEEAANLDDELMTITDKAAQMARKAYITSLREQVTTQLNLATDLGAQFAEYLSLFDPYDRLLAIITENQWSSKTAKAVNDLLLPILKATMKLRPKDVLGNAVQVGVCLLTEGQKGYALYQFCADPANAPKEAAQLNKLLSEVNQIKDKLTALQPKANPN